MASGENPQKSVESACQLAAAAFAARPSPGDRAARLEAVAAALEADRAQILHKCCEETALTIDELTPEFARMTGTLRMFAGLVREGSWVRAAIDSGSPSATAGLPRRGDTPTDPHGGTSPPWHKELIGPDHDVRRMLIPLGPVAVFGASNFPLAYGVCGGDTASALAAGCAVVVKEHPAHPKTGRLIAGIAKEAIKDADGPDGSLGYVLNESPEDHGPARALVSHPEIAGVGFTGAYGGGMALNKIASERPEPVPVFAEMGSTNAVLVSPESAFRRCGAIAEEIAKSLLYRSGQQCTAPRLVFISGPEQAAEFFDAVAALIRQTPVRRMLSDGVAANYRRGLDAVLKTGRVLRQVVQGVPVGDPRAAPAAVLLANAVEVEDSPEFLEEVFGPCVIVLQSHDFGDAFSFVPGALTLSAYFEPDVKYEGMPSDAQQMKGFLAGRMHHAGRVVFNGVPTGVRVAAGMVHGGPWPATNRPDTTAVGPMAIERWCRPVCFQNCPDELLPPELQDSNPRGIMRLVNGEWSRGPVKC